MKRFLGLLRNAISSTEFSLFLFFLALTITVSSSLAKADTLTMGGNLSSDNTAVGSGDTVITDPSKPMIGDALSMKLTYDPLNFTPSASNPHIDVLNNATFSLSFDGYNFNYASGSYIAVSLPGAYGSGTVSFQICTSGSACADPFGDFINLYYSGTVTSVATLSAQASGLTGYASASPSQFEFVRNFAIDGSQTDLHGTLTTPSGAANTVPEPSSLLLLGSGLAGMAWRRLRR